MKGIYKIVELLPMREGVSEHTGREWKSREVVLESVEQSAWPDVVVGALRGDMAAEPGVKEGDTVVATLSLYARKQDGHWWNSVRIVSIVKSENQYSYVH